MQMMSYVKYYKMSFIVKQLLINKFHLPKEMIDIIKDYAFHKIKKIPEDDERYKILRTIPFKEYDHTDDTTYVYLYISEDKDYFLVYEKCTIYIQTFFYDDNNGIHLLEYNLFSIANPTPEPFAFNPTSALRTHESNSSF